MFTLAEVKCNAKQRRTRLRKKGNPGCLTLIPRSLLAPPRPKPQTTAEMILRSAATFRHASSRSDATAPPPWSAATFIVCCAACSFACAGCGFAAVPGGGGRVTRHGDAWGPGQSGPQGGRRSPSRRVRQHGQGVCAPWVRCRQVFIGVWSSRVAGTVSESGRFTTARLREWGQPTVAQRLLRPGTATWGRVHAMRPRCGPWGGRAGSSHCWGSREQFPVALLALWNVVRPRVRFTQRQSRILVSLVSQLLTGGADEKTLREKTREGFRLIYSPPRASASAPRSSRSSQTSPLSSTS